MKRLALALLLATPLASAPARAEATFGLSFARAKDTVDDAWVDGQIEEANRLFAPLGTTFRWTMQKGLAEPHGEMHSRSDRDQLTPLMETHVVDVFVVRELEDVDEPGRPRRGVCWTGLGGKRFLILSKIAMRGVLAHELGHLFGNPHSKVVNNVMSYDRDGGVTFFDEHQMGIIKGLSAQFLSAGRLFDIGPPRRGW